MYLDTTLPFFSVHVANNEVDQGLGNQPLWLLSRNSPESTQRASAPPLEGWSLLGVLPREYTLMSAFKCSLFVILFVPRPEVRLMVLWGKDQETVAAWEDRGPQQRGLCDSYIQDERHSQRQCVRDS